MASIQDDVLAEARELLVEIRPAVPADCHPQLDQLLTDIKEARLVCDYCGEPGEIQLICDECLDTASPSGEAPPLAVASRDFLAATLKASPLDRRGDPQRVAMVDALERELDKWK